MRCGFLSQKVGCYHHDLPKKNHHWTFLNVKKSTPFSDPPAAASVVPPAPWQNHHITSILHTAWSTWQGSTSMPFPKDGIFQWETYGLLVDTALAVDKYSPSGHPPPKESDVYQCMPWNNVKLRRWFRLEGWTFSHYSEIAFVIFKISSFYILTWSVSIWIKKQSSKLMDSGKNLSSLQ